MKRFDYQIVAKITVNDKRLFVTCCYLDYRVEEPMRMQEMKKLELNLQEIFQNKGAQIWTGDFNSPTKGLGSENETIGSCQ